MTLRLIALFAALLGLGWAIPARGCSVGSDYIRPSNFELVQIADAIVIATPEARVDEDRLRFRVVQAVKGTPPRQLVVPWAVLGTPPPSNLTDLATSNPEGYAGPCNRMSFRQGSRYLLFISRDPDGTWRQLGFPFSRVNEDYAGEDTIWMRTVRRYLSLQQRLAPMARIEALTEMRASGRTPEGQALAPSERTDIADHLSSVSQWKPTAWLLGVYARAEQGEAMTMRPDAANGEGNAFAGVVRALLDRVEPDQGPRGPERVRIAVLTALAEGDHPDALPLFDRLWEAPGTSPAIRGLALRYLARNGQFARAYQWIETRLMAQLPTLERRDAMRLIGDVTLTMGSEGFVASDGTAGPPARWRGDPHAAATWPELALSLYWYQANTFSADSNWPLSAAIRAIPVTDFRARPLLTLALAANYDDRVSAWAIAELARPPVPRPDGRQAHGRERLSDPAMLPLRVLVMDSSPEKVAALIRVFCEGGARRRLAIFALGEWGPSLSDELLGRMAAFPRLDEDDRRELRIAAIKIAAREIGHGGEALLFRGNDEDWLVTRLLSRRPPPQARLPENRAALSCPG